MVCDRCIKVVREELQHLGLDMRSVTLGEAIVSATKGELDVKKIRETLEANGFELLDNKQSQIVERIKNAIIRLVHYNHDEKELKLNYSEYISKELGLEYHYLSSLFSSTEGITIEKFIILQKIERVKELLKYDELTLSEIAYKMGYSSVPHLSNQFKQVTGFSPSHFKHLKTESRKPLDKVR
ncbi:MAG: helix-turn-helix transcriptional regulator [Ignavibacteriales bacterium]|nr:helix-turn-helix transcriptional regulator [Ignavibacteriales bacterium]